MMCKGIGDPFLNQRRVGVREEANIQARGRTRIGSQENLAGRAGQGGWALSVLLIDLSLPQRPKFPPRRPPSATTTKGKHPRSTPATGHGSEVTLSRPESPLVWRLGESHRLGKGELVECRKR